MVNKNKIIAELEQVLENIELCEQVLLNKAANRDFDLRGAKGAGILAVLDHAAFKIALINGLEYNPEAK